MAEGPRHAGTRAVRGRRRPGAEGLCREGRARGQRPRRARTLPIAQAAACWCLEGREPPRPQHCGYAPVFKGKRRTVLPGFHRGGRAALWRTSKAQLRKPLVAHCSYGPASNLQLRAGLSPSCTKDDPIYVISFCRLIEREAASTRAGQGGAETSRSQCKMVTFHPESTARSDYTARWNLEPLFSLHLCVKQEQHEQTQTFQSSLKAPIDAVSSQLQNPFCFLYIL
ncbi:uncharacterized protein LOC142362311 [Opisthocomus hoazin]|uniref:uncharacterized protein LOC142362311 n=1 Tax=Opisthocomus hoazin TaxID=30419 RepID=UPI003F534F93